MSYSRKIYELSFFYTNVKGKTKRISERFLSTEEEFLKDAERLQAFIICNAKRHGAKISSVSPILIYRLNCVYDGYFEIKEFEENE